MARYPWQRPPAKVYRRRVGLLLKDEGEPAQRRTGLLQGLGHKKPGGELVHYPSQVDEPKGEVYDETH